MPTTPAERRLSRRTAVGVGLAGAAAVVTGCTPTGIDRRPKPEATVSRAPGVDPDVALAATVLAHEQAVLALVLAILEQHPDLEPTLSTARSAHRAHVDLLQDAVPDDVRVPATGATSPGVSPSVSPTVTPAPRVPARLPVAIRAVATAEDRLALVDRRSSFAAESGAFARVLASMAAAAAQQAAALADSVQVRP